MYIYCPVKTAAFYLQTQSLPDSTSSESEAEDSADPPADAAKGPEPSTRSDSYDRVEKLREEMRSSSRPQSMDIQTTRYLPLKLHLV